MITMTVRHTRRQVRPATRPQPTPPAMPQCLHPNCHAHHAHPANRPATPPMPATPPAAPRVPWYRKITKNMVIGFLVVIIIGLAGSLNDDDHQIADLKAKAGHSATQDPQQAKMAKLQYAITYCGKVAAQGDEAECIQETLGR